MRLGVPRASRADDILTPKTGKPSASAGKYMNQLLAEYLLGHPIDWGGASLYMDRGTAMEPQAREWYALVHGGELTPVGFITTEAGTFGTGTFGCSPDSLAGDDGLLEVKCPAIHTFIGYLRDPASLVAEYRGQVQAQLWVSEREWCDLLAFHPDLPPVVQRVTADDVYRHHFRAAVNSFVDALEDAKKELAPYRRTAPTIAAVEAAEAANAA
jgi:hypothetical protein